MQFTVIKIGYGYRATLAEHGIAADGATQEAALGTVLIRAAQRHGRRLGVSIAFADQTGATGAHPAAPGGHHEHAPVLASPPVPAAKAPGDVEHTRVTCGGFFVPGHCFARLRRRPGGDVLFLAGAEGGPSLLDGMEEAVSKVLGPDADRATLRLVAYLPWGTAEISSYVLVELRGGVPIISARSKEDAAAEVGVEETFLDVPLDARNYVAPPPPPAFDDVVIARHRFRTSWGEGTALVRIRKAGGRTLVLVAAVRGGGYPSPGNHLEEIVSAVAGAWSSAVAVVDVSADGHVALVQMHKGGPCWNFTPPKALALILGVEEAFFDIGTLCVGRD